MSKTTIDPIKAMDEYAKQEAIGFAEWKDENYVTHYNNGKVVCYRAIKNPTTTITTEQLYLIYQQSKQKA